MNGELKEGEPHPMAQSAVEYVMSQGSPKLMMLREAFASTALSGSRLSEICGDTLERLLNNQPVSDRYVLGLAWFIKQDEDNHRG